MTSKTDETIEKNRVWQTLHDIPCRGVRFQSWEDYPYWHCNQRLTMSLTVEASLFGCIFYWERCSIPPRFIYRVCWIQSQILPSSQFTLNELVNNTSDFPFQTFAGIQFLSHYCCCCLNSECQSCFEMQNQLMQRALFRAINGRLGE